jgi:hypothetical protein
MKRIIIIYCLLTVVLKGYTQSTYVQIQDTRITNDPPTYFKSRLALDFKESSVIGMPGSAIYSAVLTIAPWTDYSGGKNHQLSFNDGGLFYRIGSHLSPTWETWRKIVIEDGVGNVGIGTATPNEKLSVNGKIRAHEIKVELSGWSDFVFAKDYALPTLQETEKHIKDKGHLPGIPSAAEVEKNGIELGDMNKKLLQKIEELTLYMIEKDKEVQKIKQDSENYRKRLETLEINQK